METSFSSKHQNRVERDREFMALFNRAYKMMVNAGVSDPRRQAVRFVVYNGTPRYHVSFYRAYEVVCSLLLRHKQPLLEGERLEMWLEIADRVKQLVDTQHISIAQAVEFVLENCRATRFYVDEDYAYHNIVTAATLRLRTTSLA